MEILAAIQESGGQFAEYPKMSLVLEPPGTGPFYSIKKVPPPLYTWAKGMFSFDDLELSHDAPLAG